MGGRGKVFVGQEETCISKLKIFRENGVAGLYLLPGMYTRRRIPFLEKNVSKTLRLMFVPIDTVEQAT